MGREVLQFKHLVLLLLEPLQGVAHPSSLCHHQRQWNFATLLLSQPRHGLPSHKQRLLILEPVTRCTQYRSCLTNNKTIILRVILGSVNQSTVQLWFEVFLTFFSTLKQRIIIPSSCNEMQGDWRINAVVILKC